MGKLQSILGPVQYGGCPVHSDGVNLKAEVMETLLYGCETWTLGNEHFAELRTAHQRPLLRIILLPAPTTHKPPHVRQGPQEDTMRERRDDHPQTGSPLCGGRSADEQ